MNTSRDPYELAGEYVLGTLPTKQRRQVERALAGDTALRHAVEFWEQRLLPLAGYAEPVSPSVGVWAQIEDRLGFAKPAMGSAPRRHWSERLLVWRALAACGFAAAAIMAVVVGLRNDQVESPRYMVVLAAPQNAAPGWMLRIANDRTLHLEPLARTNVPDQRALQLWTKADSWKSPVSLGLIKPGQAIEIKLDKLPPVQANQLFEITLEPVAGSPINRPTGPILYIGRAVRI